MRAAVFEGERAYGGVDLQARRAYARACTNCAKLLGFEIPYSVEAINQASQELLARQGHADAYVRPIAWRGSEMMGVSAQQNTINVAIAVWEWPSYFKPEEKLKGIRLDIAEYRRPDPATAPALAKADRPLHDLHHLQARGRAQRLRRRADVRLARPDRGGDRRQRLLRQGRRHPYADARLLPRRHHPAHRHRACQAARLPGRSSGRSCPRRWPASRNASSPALRRK